MKQACFVIALCSLLSVAHAREDTLQSLADQLALGLCAHGPIKVAVLALPHHDHRFSTGPVLVSERLTTLLSREKNVVIVERNHIVQALRQKGLSETGELDPATTKLMGQLLDADVLVIGT